MRCISTFWPTLTFENFEFQVFSNKGVKVFTNKIVFLLMLLFVVVSYQFKSLFSFSVRKSFSQWFFAAASSRNDSLCKSFLIIVLMLSQSLSLFDCFVICRYMLCCLLYETLVSFLIHMCLLLIPWQWYFELWKNVKHVNRSFFQYFDDKMTNLFSKSCSL
jgi:hypothetical protein